MIDEFLSLIGDACGQFGSRVGSWEGRKRHAGNLYQIATEERTLLLHIKESNADPGFWGLSPNLLAQLSQSGAPWLLILLSNRRSVAYICTPVEVGHRAGTLWPQARHGDYKIHENAQVLGIPSLNFNEAAEFLAHLVGRSGADSGSEYQSLVVGSLRADQVAFCIARLPGSGNASHALASRTFEPSTWLLVC